jgi:hypothetical protein
VTDICEGFLETDIIDGFLAASKFIPEYPLPFEETPSLTNKFLVDNFFELEWISNMSGSYSLGDLNVKMS